eukprot:3997125-Heterocapsa_arctica.AAC.1
MTRFVNATNFDEYSVPLRLLRYKYLLREAARVTRNELMILEPAMLHVCATTCASIARAVWHNDDALAR